MVGHKLNRYSKKLRKRSPSLAQLSDTGFKAVRDEQTGFIYHPSGFPLEFKRLWFGDKLADVENEQGKLGVIFQSEKYFKPGVTVEIVIPLRGELEKFRGKVVLVRSTEDYYEIGLWLYHQADCSRVRIVEQICHIETYLQQKKYKEGPYNLNRDRVAKEWISKYASSVPSS